MLTEKEMQRKIRAVPEGVRKGILIDEGFILDVLKSRKMVWRYHRHHQDIFGLNRPRVGLNLRPRRARTGRLRRRWIVCLAHQIGDAGVEGGGEGINCFDPGLPFTSFPS